MNDIEQKTNLLEKLGAKTYLGGGTLGLVPYGVFTTSEDTSLGLEIKKAFKSIENTQSQTYFSINQEKFKNSSSEKILFILKGSTNQPNIEIISKDIFLIHRQLKTDTFIKSLPYVFYNLSEKLRQEKYGLVTIHGAAASRNENGVLILGDKGAGKTSLLLALCLSHGYEIIGNDSLLIGGNENTSLVTGNKQISVRLPVGKKFGIPMGNAINSKSGIDYETKISFLPLDLGIKETQKPAPLKLTVRVNIHSENKNFVVSNIPSLELEVLRLNENFGRYIRGITTPLELSGPKIFGYFPSLDNKELTEFRNDLINRLLTKIPFLYVAGNNPLVIAEKLDKFLNHL